MLWLPEYKLKAICTGIKFGNDDADDEMIHARRSKSRDNDRIGATIEFKQKAGLRLFKIVINQSKLRCHLISDDKYF